MANALEKGQIQQEAAFRQQQGGGIIRDTHREKIKAAVVYIKTSSHKGTGFLANYKEKLVLITCNHVIPNKETARQEQCKVYFHRRKYSIDGRVLFDTAHFFKTSTEDELDTTVIAVNPSPEACYSLPGAKFPDPIPLWTECKMDGAELKAGDGLTVVHYPLPKHERAENSFTADYFQGHFLGHLAGTAKGSSGCPVLREKNGQWFVVGIHRGYKDGVNVASLMPYVYQYLQGSYIPKGGIKDFTRECLSKQPQKQGPDTLTAAEVQKEFSYRLDAKWNEIGTHLGVDYPKLQSIAKDNSYQCGSCMTALLGKWLTNEEGTGILPRTWHTVAHAVHHSGRPKLAKDIADKYNVQMST